MNISTSPTIRRLRSELQTAVDALTNERERVQLLTKGYEQALGQRDVEAARTSEVMRRTDIVEAKLRLSEQALTRSQEHSKRLFERYDFEAMSREQLLSFAEGSINEARRKGLREAEGLASRQLKLSRETDLDLMRGVVKEYQSRIAEVEAELKPAAPTKVDTRPLSAKLEMAQPAKYKAPVWWDSTPTTPAVAAAQAPGFIPFDRRASAITAAAKAKEPRTLADGQVLTVPGSAGGQYILERKGDVYSCTCPAWRWSRSSTNRRTCKHLEACLGEKAEHDRITAYLLPMTCHCGEILVRGQCQVHTTNWKGDENCTCGRKFASCKAAYDTISVAQRGLGHQPELAK